MIPFFLENSSAGRGFAGAGMTVYWLHMNSVRHVENHYNRPSVNAPLAEVAVRARMQPYLEVCRRCYGTRTPLG
jgi:hypothetical protein